MPGRYIGPARFIHDHGPLDGLFVYRRDAGDVDYDDNVVNDVDQIIEAFCHWTWHYSNGKYLYCNARGLYTCYPCFLYLLIDHSHSY